MTRGKKKDKKKEEKKAEKKEEEPVPSVASLSLSESQPSTSHHQPFDDEGTRKKKKASKDRPISMEVTVEAGGDSTVPEKPKQQSDTVKPQDELSKKVEDYDNQKRKETKEDDEEVDGLGLGLGGRKNRRKKKKFDNPPTATPAPQTVTVPQPQKTTVPSVTTEEVKATPPVWGQSKPMQPKSAPSSSQQRTPESASMMQPSTSRAQVAGRGAGRFQSTDSSKVPSGPSRDVVKPKASLGSAPMCIFKIPDKVFGRKVPARSIRLLANYLEMTIQPLKIHRYDVIFKPDKPKKFLPMAYNLAVKKYFGKVLLAFDQRKNVYSLTALSVVPANDRFKCDVTVIDCNDRKINFEVSFKFTGIVDLGTIITYMKTGGTSLNPPTEAIQAVDVILRQGTLESYVKSGRQFFKRPQRPLDLGEGLEMWTGLFQSAIFTSRPYVNIDVAHKGFPRQQLLVDTYTQDFHLDINKPISEQRHQRNQNIETFLQFLKALKVVAYVGGDIKKGPQREFICNELVEPPHKMFFTMNEGTPNETKCSVIDYFEKEKNCRIRFPNLNCVWVGPKDKKIYYPMEFLMISYGQISNKQLNEQQLSKLVKESATPPLDRKRKIEEVIADMNYSKSEYFKKFGLDIANHFVNIDAKVLQAPKIDVGGAPVDPRRGVWQSKRLLKPQPLDSWALISVDTDKCSFDTVVGMIVGIGNEMGMGVKNPKMVSFNVKVTELMKTLQIVKDKGILFLFVIISGRGRDYYHKLKRTAEREVGILTQCIKENTATRKLNEQTVRNIMLKVNSKLMGINHALDARSIPACLQQGKIMLVGADVTHPSPEQSSVPSIAAVTASIDPRFTIYNITLSVQTPKKEMIVDFEDMMVEHLNEFEKRQRDLPSKIFVFRDGVSEGQFAQVMNSELQAVHNAYKRKTGPGSTRRPEVLFLLVQKRHHTRFFLGDSLYNVEPGTVVDTHIVHPKELDFYLVSHQAIKGTARPTRYHAVCNDGRIAQDEVEQLTYYLCHLYARCTRSVSYPTPTYYAHLACMRARSLTFGDKFSNADLEKAPQRLRVLERILETSRMFFV